VGKSGLGRKWVWLLAIAACVGAVAVVIALKSMNAQEPPWPDMEKAVRSFPVPPGGAMSEPVRSGGSCSALNPSCKSPLVSASVALATGEAVTCERVGAMVATWGERGFILESGPSSHSGVCAFDGHVNGISAGVSFGQGVIAVSAGVPG